MILVFCFLGLWFRVQGAGVAPWQDFACRESQEDGSTRNEC